MTRNYISMHAYLCLNPMEQMVLLVVCVVEGERMLI